MCLVEIVGPRGSQLMTSCTTPVAEGMAVHTKSPQVVEAQREVLEFILTNHPLDCPICDKGGECPLQDTTLHYGPAVSHFEEQKRHKNKHYPISPLIMLDQERCILCWRCTRYLEEWSDDPQLGLFERGGETIIDTFPDRPVTAKTSGSIIDLCPVGALTNRVSRFHYRPWQISKTSSVCPHCTVGCNLRLDARTQELRRIVARENMEVNDEWICDKGRFVHGFVDSPQRLTTPLVRRNGELQEATWDEALDTVVAGFTRIINEKGPDAVGGIGSAKLTNEAAYLFQKFMRAVIGTNNVDHRLGSAVKAAPAGLSAIPDIQKAGVLFLFGVDPSEEAPILELFMKRAVRRNGGQVIVANPRRIELARYGGPNLTYKPGTEGALLKGLAHIILKEGWATDGARRATGLDDFSNWLEDATPEETARHTGVDEENLRRTAKLWATSETGVLFYGPSAVQGPAGEAVLAGLTSLAYLAGKLDTQGMGLSYVGREANAQGARDVGLLPHILPGYQPLDDADVRKRLRRLWGADLPSQPGLGYHEMLHAAAKEEIAALYIIAADPLGDRPALAGELASSFLVVQDLFLSDTARQADVVLPAASFTEQEGTFTNVARRVQPLRQALRPKGQSLADWSILLQLANRWPDEKKIKKQTRARWRYLDAAAICQEMAKAMPIYGDLSWEGLGELGQTWDETHLPKTVLHHYRRVDAPIMAAAGEYPLSLLAGSLLYDGGTLVAYSHGEFQQVIPQSFVLVHPQDAEKAGVQDGETARLVSPTGDLAVPVKVSEEVNPGVLWLPESLADTPVGALLNGGSPVVAVRIEKAT